MGSLHPWGWSLLAAPGAGFGRGGSSCSAFPSLRGSWAVGEQPRSPEVSRAGSPGVVALIKANSLSLKNFVEKKIQLHFLVY